MKTIIFKDPIQKFYFISGVQISKKLLSFCDIEWSEKALDFYKREDLLSKTASNIQIRKQIYKYNKKRFEPYRHYFKDSPLPLKNLDL